MRKSKSGFTIVELLVVIAIIGILTTIGTLSFTHYQASTRDTQRSSKTAIIAEALEKYYDKNGEYPSCSALTQPASVVDTSVLPGIDPLALLTPGSTPTDTNSIKCSDLTTASTSPDIFAYVGDGSAACATGASCLSWTLKYTDESSGTVKTIQSRRNTAIATSGTSTLSASPASFTQINLSWTPINNAISYQVQQATNAAFTTNVTNTTTSSLSLSATGLAYNTTYYFRVMPNAATSTGNWSNTSVVATWGLATPTAGAAATSSTSFNVTWSPSVPYATSYTVQLSSDGTTWSTGWQVAGATTSPVSFPGATQGWKYYIRIQAINGPYASAWSSVVSTITPIDNPAAFPLWSTNLLPGWNYLNLGSGVSCPAGTSPSNDWYINGGYWMTGGVSQSYGLSWNQSVTASVASRCTSANTSSGFVWASNTASMSLPWSSVWMGITSFRHAAWGATCPKWTTSSSYDWWIRGNSSSWLVGENGVQTTSYDNQGIVWGDGDGRVAIHCYGPWGGDARSDGWMDFGSGCQPTILTSWCTY